MYIEWKDKKSGDEKFGVLMLFIDIALKISLLLIIKN